jgi:hypothetical protein
MNARRRRALVCALAAVVVAVLCAALSSNVHGTQRGVLLVLTAAWLIIAAVCVSSALRTAPASQVPTEVDDEPA